ncbi:hypothetical protein Catovirus_1_814 [Catovirus CTV1]|uniref:Nucleotide-diphospho-sugar transferase domain-containing protein n=1 Tax=Catovirus CTV1 TaxID=1977631 RepID=A0A1V0SAR4_9VIRU|nr:hypothetical protein Catovirus_1_814 [Catovirus CTV1]
MIDNKYPIKINRYAKKKKYAIGMLVYPGLNESKWNYLFGACMVSYRLKKNDWFKQNCDIIILTPVVENTTVLSLIKKNFDVHAVYSTSLNTEYPFKTNPRWYGVFNKLYFWNKNCFSYDRLLILDTDMFILKPDDYIEIINSAQGPVAGCYENGFIVNNTDLDLSEINTIIPDKYTSYVWNNNKSYYNMVNAGVLSIQPNFKLFQIMLRDLEDGWKKLPNKYPALKNKKNNFLFPEQEYLTGFFSGKWRSLPSKFLSCATSSCHYNNHGAKYWDKFPSSFGIYSIVVSDSIKFLNKYSECKEIFNNIISNTLLAGNIAEPLKPTELSKTITELSSVGNNLLKKSISKKNINDITNPFAFQNDNLAKKNDIPAKAKDNMDKEFVGITTFGQLNKSILENSNNKKDIQHMLVPNHFPYKKPSLNDNDDDPENLINKLNSVGLKKNFTKLFNVSLV